MPAASAEQLSPLKDLRALVVEDEAIVSFLLEDTLLKLGCAEVTLAGRLSVALDYLDRHRPDVAVLDVNLGGELVYPVAERLKAASVPFVFATGYGASGIAPEWKDAFILQKPFAVEQLAALLETVVRK
ncbi:MAG TPA: response regulator [Rhizomicrobium sp.]|jgi:DNA-binding response OmpR family regulator|nr:response regulator [Rhizomicrobium sp.]